MVWVKRNEKKISAALKMPKVKKKKKITPNILIM